MIRQLFIPNNIKNYYIVPQTIVGIDITKTSLYATKVIASGYKRTIIECIEQPIESYDGLTFEEKIQKALTDLKAKLKFYNILKVALPSSNAVFKEIIIPFLGEPKVKKVIPFEVEPLLPFSLNQATLDSITIKENIAKKETTVLVAAVPHSFLNSYLDIFEKAGLKPDKITIDMFELYALYSELYNAQPNKDQTVAIIDLDLHTTRLALIINGQLKYIRTLSKGLKNIADRLTTGDKNSIAMLEEFTRFGVQPDNKDIFKDLISELQFTLVTSLKKFSEDKKLDQVFLTGRGADIQGVSDLICSMLKTSCRTLEPKKILHNGNIYSSVATLDNRFLISLATAMPLKSTSSFNLSSQAYITTINLLTQQILAFLALTIAFLALVLGYSFIKVRNLRKIYNTSNSQAINKLKSTMSLPKSQYKNLSEANREAKNKLTTQQQAISRLLHKNSSSFLVYLDELSRVIDQERTGLIINKMDITPDTITIQGSVKDISAVKVLENQLEQSSLFTLKTLLQTPDFTKTPLVLEIKHDRIEE